MCSVLLWPFKTILTQSMELGRETPFSSHVILAAVLVFVSHRQSFFSSAFRGFSNYFLPKSFWFYIVSGLDFYWEGKSFAVRKTQLSAKVSIPCGVWNKSVNTLLFYKLLKTRTGLVNLDKNTKISLQDPGLCDLWFVCDTWFCLFY